MPKKEPSFNKEYLSEKLLAMKEKLGDAYGGPLICLLYTSPSPRDGLLTRMPSSA